MTTISRRLFLSRSVQATAGIGALTGCNSREFLGADIRLPSAPRQLTTVSADRSVTLSWGEHDRTDVTGAHTEQTVSSFHVYRNGRRITTDPVFSLSYTDDELLENGTSYGYQLAAIDSSGNESPLSDVVPATPRLAIRVSLNNSAAHISWEANPSAAGKRTGFALYRKYSSDEVFSPVGSLSVSDTTFVDNTVEIFASPSYKIIPFGPAGNESPSSIGTLPSTIVHVVNTTSVDPATGRIHAAQVSSMLDEGLMRLTKSMSTAQAWERLFPSLTTDTIIGIKVNTLAGTQLSTHPVVVEAVVAGLTSMLGATFPAENIIIFDDRDTSRMEAAGFIPADEPGSPRCLSTQGRWSSEAHSIHGVSQHLSALVEEADYLINIPVLKDHNLGGITFALKNYYGIIDRPMDMHENYCDPYIAGVYALAAAKTRLIIGDALLAVHVGGPSSGPTFLPCSLLLGTDPVAVDTYGLSLINKERSGQGFTAISLKSGEGQARHVSTAAAEPYLLGTNDLDNIVIEKIE